MQYRGRFSAELRRRNRQETEPEPGTNQNGTDRRQEIGRPDGQPCRKDDRPAGRPHPPGQFAGSCRPEGDRGKLPTGSPATLPGQPCRGTAGRNETGEREEKPAPARVKKNRDQPCKIAPAQVEKDRPAPAAIMGQAGRGSLQSTPGELPTPSTRTERRGTARRRGAPLPSSTTAAS